MKILGFRSLELPYRQICWGYWYDTAISPHFSEKSWLGIKTRYPHRSRGNGETHMERFCFICAHRYFKHWCNFFFHSVAFFTFLQVFFPYIMTIFFSIFWKNKGKKNCTNFGSRFTIQQWRGTILILTLLPLPPPSWRRWSGGLTTCSPKLKILQSSKKNETKQNSILVMDSILRANNFLPWRFLAQL